MSPSKRGVCVREREREGERARERPVNGEQLLLTYDAQIYETFVILCVTCSVGLSGAFAEFRKASVSFVMSVCSRVVHVDELGSHKTVFHEM
jgi:hypothetical protein